MKNTKTPSVTPLVQDKQKKKASKKAEAMPLSDWERQRLKQERECIATYFSRLIIPIQDKKREVEIHKKIYELQMQAYIKIATEYADDM